MIDYELESMISKDPANNRMFPPPMRKNASRKTFAARISLFLELFKALKLFGLQDPLIAYNQEPLTISTDSEITFF